MRQPVGEIGRTVAVVGVDVSDQRFRRAESGRRGRGFEHGNHKNQNRSNYLCHRRSLYLRAALSYSWPINEHCRIGGRKREMRELFDEVAGKSPLDPEALVAREAAHWDPIVFWAADALGAHFILAEGIVYVRQPDSAIAAARAALPTNAWSIAALHVVTTLTGSALLALALMRGVIDQDQAWAAAHVDEDWNIEQWGRDEEVAARRAAWRVDFRAAAAVLKSTA